MEFPITPTPGQQYTAGNRTWQWNALAPGTWELVPVSKTDTDAAAASASAALAAALDAAQTALALGSYDGGTLLDLLDQLKPLAHYGALRAYSGRAKTIRITQAGLAGYFERTTDTTAVDNGGTVIVDALGRRWKRPVGHDLTHLEWFGAIGDWNGTGTGTLNTAAIQNYMTYLENHVGSGIAADGYFLTAGITMGNPATAAVRSGSDQGTGIYAFRGSDRLRFQLVAADGVETLLKRNNFAGVALERFGLEGRGVTPYGLDLSWIYGPAGAPSCQNILRDVNINGFTRIGALLNGFHDSTIDSLRVGGSPMSVLMIGGGGSLRATNWNTSGVVKVGAQDMSFKDCELLGGFVNSGNTNNVVGFSGGQIFPIGTGGRVFEGNSNDAYYVAPVSMGYAIDCAESGTYGSNLNIKDALVFGGGTLQNPLDVGVLRGRFYTGGVFENVIFNWSPTAQWAGEITTGANRRPVFRFTNCQFLQVNCPFNMTPEQYAACGYDWVMENCQLANGQRVTASSLNSATFTPVLASSNGAAQPANAYYFAKGEATKSGRDASAYFDFQITELDAAMMAGGDVMVTGLPWPSAGLYALGGVSWSVVSGVTLEAGYTELTASPGNVDNTIRIFQQGSGKQIKPLPVSALSSSVRLAGKFSYFIHPNAAY